MSVSNQACHPLMLPADNTVGFVWFMRRTLARDADCMTMTAGSTYGLGGAWGELGGSLWGAWGAFWQHVCAVGTGARRCASGDFLRKMQKQGPSMDTDRYMHDSFCIVLCHACHEMQQQWPFDWPVHRGGAVGLFSNLSAVSCQVKNACLREGWLGVTPQVQCPLVPINVEDNQTLANKRSDEGMMPVCAWRAPAHCQSFCDAHCTLTEFCSSLASFSCSKLFANWTSSAAEAFAML